MDGGSAVVLQALHRHLRGSFDKMGAIVAVRRPQYLRLKIATNKADVTFFFFSFFLHLKCISYVGMNHADWAPRIKSCAELKNRKRKCIPPARFSFRWATPENCLYWSVFATASSRLHRRISKQEASLKVFYIHTYVAHRRLQRSGKCVEFITAVYADRVCALV